MIFKIPLAIHSHISYLTITDHEFGDPNSLTMILPEEANGKVHLPRSFFSEEILSKLEEKPE